MSFHANIESEYFYQGFVMKMYSLYKQCSGNFLLSDLKLSSLKMAFFWVISILNDCYPQIPANTAGKFIAIGRDICKLLL